MIMWFLQILLIQQLQLKWIDSFFVILVSASEMVEGIHGSFWLSACRYTLKKDR